MRFVSPCWKPSVEGENSSNGGDAAGRAEGLLWYKDSGQHVNGEFSMAVIQANNLLEDCSHLESGPMSSAESGPHGTFVGVYDGHGGPEAARFVNERLFENIKSKFLLLIYDELHSYSNDCIMSFMESQSGLLIFL
jgi:pyruvate dehydrogenase phosphatase